MTMLTQILFTTSLGLLAATAQAQCSTLAVTGTGLPGTTLTVAVDGPAATHGIVFLLVGAAQGSTTINLGPAASLTLGLADPFLPVPLGMADASGDITRSLDVPSGLTMGVDVFGQSLTLGFSFSLPTGGGMPSFGVSTCTSNVVPFHVGA
jgi:hypothetical protein